MVGLGRGPGFFEIDRNSGAITVSHDLMKGSELEYTVSIHVISDYLE